MTYKHVCFQPGPRINLVIGPNGVGKSSILCAVVLGLGGKPKLLGRQKELSNFVRRVADIGSPQDKAKIQVTLKADAANSSFDQDPVIERVFSRSSNTSKWKLNGKQTNEKTVTEIVRDTFGIRLDNLCMFLPQDIVQKFSEYNNQQLLQETQTAILGEASVNEQERLKKLVEEDKHRDSKRKLLQQEQDKETRKKEQLANDVAAYLEYQKKKSNLDKRKGKLYFLEFQDLQARGKVLKDVKKAAKKEFETKSKLFEPLAKEQELAKKNLTKHQKAEKKLIAKHNKSSENMKLHQRGLSRLMKKHGTTCEDVHEYEIDLKKKQIKLQKMIAMKPSKEDHVKEFPPQDELKQEKQNIISKFKPELLRLKKGANAINKDIFKEEEKTERLSDSRSQIQTRLIQAKNIGKTKLNILFQNKKNRIVGPAFRCAQDLKRFKGKTKGVVVGPMILHISTREDITMTNSLASTIEQAIGMRWKFAFAFTDAEDYDMLCRQGTSDWKHITYAVVQNQPMNQSRIENQRPVSSETLKTMRKDGLIGYVDQLITGSPMVMNLLYGKAGIHKTMVGDGRNLANQENVSTILESISETAGQRQSNSGGSSSSSSSSSSSNSNSNSGSRMKGLISLVTQTHAAFCRVTEYGNKQVIISFQPHRFKALGILLQRLDRNLIKKLESSMNDVEQELEQANGRVATLKKKISPLMKQQGKLKEKAKLAMADVNRQLLEQKNAVNKVKKLGRVIAGLEDDIEEVRQDLQSSLKKIQQNRTTLWYGTQT